MLAENVEVDQKVDVDEGVAEHPELPSLRCRSPSELLINPGNIGVANRENNGVDDAENNAQDGRTDNSVAEKDPTDGGVDDNREVRHTNVEDFPWIVVDEGQNAGEEGDKYTVL